MKGIILAGGLGSRLYPLTYATNKHLLPVYDKPMIYYPIQTLVKAGIKEILIIVSGPHSGHFIPVLKNGKEFGVEHIEFAYQEKPDGGIADALAIARSFAEGDDITVILGDNTTDADISKPVKDFKEGASIFLKRVPNPNKYGVPRFDEKDPKKIIEILEKPKDPPSDFAVTGVYIYDKNVFEIIKTCKPSWRGELEITDVNNAYLKLGKLTWAELDGYWLDAGSFNTLYLANKYWTEKKNPSIKNISIE